MKKYKPIKNTFILQLDNDGVTNGVTTFKNSLGDSILAVIMPTNFDKWNDVIIRYKVKKRKL